MNEFLGLVAEVKTNRRVDFPKHQQVDYVRPFLGNVPTVLVAFSEGNLEPTWQDGCLKIGNTYALEWIFARASWMNERLQTLTKDGSWNLSEDALSEILVLGRALGKIRERPAVRRN